MIVSRHVASDNRLTNIYIYIYAHVIVSNVHMCIIGVASNFGIFRNGLFVLAVLEEILAVDA